MVGRYVVGLVENLANMAQFFGLPSACRLVRTKGNYYAGGKYGQRRLRAYGCSVTVAQVRCNAKRPETTIVCVTSSQNVLAKNSRTFEIVLYKRHWVILVTGVHRLDAGAETCNG